MAAHLYSDTPVRAHISCLRWQACCIFWCTNAPAYAPTSSSPSHTRAFSSSHASLIQLIFDNSFSMRHFWKITSFYLLWHRMIITRRFREVLSCVLQVWHIYCNKKYQKLINITTQQNSLKPFVSTLNINTKVWFIIVTNAITQWNFMKPFVTTWALNAKISCIIVTYVTTKQKPLEPFVTTSNLNTKISYIIVINVPTQQKFIEPLVTIKNQAPKYDSPMQSIRPCNKHFSKI